MYYFKKWRLFVRQKNVAEKRIFFVCPRTRDRIFFRKAKIKIPKSSIKSSDIYIQTDPDDHTDDK